MSSAGFIVHAFYAMHLAVLSLSMETLGGPMAITALPRFACTAYGSCTAQGHDTRAVACKVGASHLHEVMHSNNSPRNVGFPFLVCTTTHRTQVGSRLLFPAPMHDEEVPVTSVSRIHAS